uniref:Ankyrin repeat domain 39 n=2 Tax=Nothobranchius TaxID=28779 RepID=A0A1A8SJI7_9TELE
MSAKQHCSCCSNPVSAHQTLEEMDFERGIWSAAMDGDLDRLRSLVQKGIDPNLRDSAGYTALTLLKISIPLPMYDLSTMGAAVDILLYVHFFLRMVHVPRPKHQVGPPHSFELLTVVTWMWSDFFCNTEQIRCSLMMMAAERGHKEVCLLLLEHCPALCSQVNKRLQLPHQLTQQGYLKEVLEPPQ